MGDRGMAKDQLIRELSELRARVKDLESRSSAGYETAERELRESEERYRLLFETMIQGVVYQRADGVIISANPAAQRILGVTLDQMQGRTSLDPRWRAIREDGSAIPGDDHPAMIALRTGVEVLDTIMGVFNPAKEAYTWIRISAVPQFKPGETTPWQVYTTFEDITGQKTAQEKLLESEKRFHALFEAMTEGVAIHELVRDPAGKPVDYRILDTNPAYEKHTGIPASTARGSLASRAYPEGKPPYLEEFIRVAEGGAPCIFETFFPPMNKYFRISVFSTGHDLFATVFEDVTEQTRSESALRESESTLRSVFRATPVGICFTRERTILSVNDFLCTTLGYQENDLVGRNTRMLYFTDEEYEAVDRELYPGLREHGWASMETRMRKNDGSEIRVSMAGAMLHGDTPSPGYVVTVQDITERKRAEEALRESEATLRSVFRATPVGISFNKDRVLLSVNDSMCETLGYTEEELIGNDARIFYFTDQEYEEAGRVLYSGIHRKGQASVETRMRKQNGSEIFVILTGRILYESNASHGYVVTVQDITERKRAENALRESEATLRSVFRAAPVGICFIKERVLVSVNDTLCETLGDTAEEMVGKNTRDYYFTDEEYQKVGYGLYSGLMQQGKTSMEIRMRKRDSSEIFISLTASPLHASDPSLGYVVTLQDITERKRAENALRESEIKYRQLHESMMDAFARVDVGGRLVEFNEVFQKMLGYEPEELKLLSYPELTPERWHDFERDIVENQVLARGYSDLYEKEYRRKSGEVFPVEMQTYLNRDKGGNPGGFWAIVRDITERKRSEEQLRRNESRYRTILTGTMDGFALVDRDGTFFDVNDRYCEILGYTREEMRPVRIYDIFVEDEKEKLLVYSRGIGGRGFARFESRQKRKDGVIIDIEASVNFIPEEDKYIVFIRDLTEQKRLEEQFRQSQKMESVGRLAGGVAHDFNNILTAIIGNVELARLTLSPSDSIYPDIQEIGKAAERAANLTRQLLAYSRKQIIAPRVLNLNHLILDMDKMLRRIVGEHIEYCTLTCPDLHSVNMDPGQVEQVLTNLVVNSRDAMPGGGKLVIETANVSLDVEYVRIHPETEPGEYVMLAVSDTGTGMDKAVLSHLFEPFFTTKPRGSGTGLGLSTCYGIVKQNRGAISVYSEPGIGTSIKVFFPAVQDASIHHLGPGERLPGYRGAETVLVVEDEPAVRSMVVRVLEEQGYTVLTAGNGEEALEVAGVYSGPIQALITDIIMPRMGGKELSQNIVSAYPAIRVLFMSGYTDNSIVHHGVLDPGLEFIQKPFSPLALAKKLRNMLDR